ncbi:MAG: hypothetical protein FJX40_15905 [Alphaproteobacteria bacterium]|nr:hypothetical protein [Alphaproteobacteria bacterium]MBM3642316.1 hypothetical protein [Alphaproteobacteria bacterium]
MAGNASDVETSQGRIIRYISMAGGAVAKAIRNAAQRVYNFIRELQPRETLICILLFAAWVGLFAAGATVKSQPIIENMSPNNFLFYLPAIAITYAYSNIAFLALLSGSLGGLLSNLSLNSYITTTKTTLEELLKGSNSRSIAYQLEPPIASAIRSFAVYLLYIAGISIVVPGSGGKGGELLVDGPQYIRIAGIISAVGFAVGYDPTIFTGLLARLSLGQPASDIDQAATQEKQKPQS